MAEINDGKFGDGLTVGAVNEILIGFIDANKEKLKLSDSSIKVISNKVGQMLGGHSGGAIAESSTTNNWLTHAEKAALAKAREEGNEDLVSFYEDLDKKRNAVCALMGIDWNLIDWNDSNNAGLRDTVTKQALEIDRIPELSWSALTPNEQTVVVATGVVVGGFIVYKINDVLFKVPAIGTGGTAVLGQSFDKMGIYVKNPNINVNWNTTTTHALQRMNERGVTQEMVNNWVKTGQVLEQSGGKYLFITQEGAVVVNNVGKVITAYPKSYFDSNMVEIVKKLFGN